MEIRKYQTSFFFLSPKRLFLTFCFYFLFYLSFFSRLSVITLFATSFLYLSLYFYLTPSLSIPSNLFFSLSLAIPHSLSFLSFSLPQPYRWGLEYTVHPPPKGGLLITPNYIRWCGRSMSYTVPLYCHYSQIHSFIHKNSSISNNLV